MTDVVQRSTDIAAHRQVELLAALLDHATPPWRAGELPPLAHWLLFPPDARQSQIGQDGHPARNDGGLPRRMWAGSRVRFLAPIPLGAEVIRETQTAAVADKVGRSGRMQFVTLQHRLFANGVECLVEEQDIVYREAGGGALPPGEAAPRPSVVREVQPDPVQLFRFSALTFNGHRIHYDRPYAVEVEGYPALVVHGPLVATLLMDHFLRRHPAAPVGHFMFRAVRPLFDNAPFRLGLEPDATGGDLGAYDADSALAMQARVDLR
jgi:3-methylfumaryl-CoA hydratase